MCESKITRSTILNVLQELIRIPSVNPGLAPHEGFDEFEIATFARDWFRSQGMRAVLDEASPNRPT